jgi:hypothetical protein
MEGMMTNMRVVYGESMRLARQMQECGIAIAIAYSDLRVHCLALV